jgi:hypothetical protein
MTAKRPRVRADRQPARYIRRLVVLEEPRVVEKLEELASASGHSVAAEIRGAVRYWISAWEDAR